MIKNYFVLLVVCFGIPDMITAAQSTNHVCTEKIAQATKLFSHRQACTTMDDYSAFEQLVLLSNDPHTEECHLCLYHFLKYIMQFHNEGLAVTQHNEVYRQLLHLEDIAEKNTPILTAQHADKHRQPFTQESAAAATPVPAATLPELIFPTPHADDEHQRDWELYERVHTER